MSIIDEFNRRISQQEIELDESRQRIAELTKTVQKLRSNIMKGAVIEPIILCDCEHPKFFETTATSTKKQCSFCGGC
jgi:hypothetical protein